MLQIMAKVLVLQHVAYEILGTLDPMIRKRGHRVRYVNFSREPDAEVELDKYAGLIILGGPMNVDMVEDYPHLATEVEIIQEAMAQKMPVLGICLGAQLIAKTLGAKVRKNPEKEIGWYDITLTEEGIKDPILKHIGQTKPIFEFHSDTYELPENCIHLASSPTCANQAFRYGNNVYGFQFHLEVDAALVERWLSAPVYQAEIAQTNGKIDPAVIRIETEKNIDQLYELSKNIFGSFLDLLGKVNRVTLIGSK